MDNSSFNQNISDALNDDFSSDIEVFKRANPLNLWRQYGFFEDSYLDNINQHWLSFPPAGKLQHRILAIIYAVIMVIGLIGNSLELLLFVRCRSLRTPSNILVVNLAVSDFLMMSKMPIFIYNSILQGPALGSIGCRLYGFVGGLTGTASICTLSAIAYDRQRIIANPLQPISNVSRSHSRRAVIYIWLYSLIFASIPLSDSKLGSYVPEGYLTSCSFDYLTDTMDAKLFILVFFVAAWVIPFIVIMVSYIKILIVVKQAKEFNFVVNRRMDKARGAEVKIAIIIIVIISVWFLAWTPYAIVALLGVFGYGHLISPLGSMIPALFCKTASCVDPFIYAILHPRYRKELNNFCLGKKQLQRKPTQTSVCTISLYRRRDGRESFMKHSTFETTFTNHKISDENGKISVASDN
ncbi:opsin, ultraviolet-sensitive-like [Ctenocephalides felis]|uniref:opsin, ultraviolet-sensitive-like n=1 Tax=Ctenocephalides felis TaxID=7515 RepID=UPI000E6E3F4F|nr:opsin, ultraviolet-sensitive-like [Ctenocephalides felis]